MNTELKKQIRKKLDEKLRNHIATFRLGGCITDVCVVDKIIHDCVREHTKLKSRKYNPAYIPNYYNINKIFNINITSPNTKLVELLGSRKYFLITCYFNDFINIIADEYYNQYMIQTTEINNHIKVKDVTNIIMEYLE